MELVNIIKDYTAIRKNYRKLFSLCHENSHYVRCLTLAVLARLRCLPTLYLAWRAFTGIVTLMRFVKPSLVQILLEDITKNIFNFSALVCGKRVILNGVNDAPLHKKHTLVKWKKQKKKKTDEDITCGNLCKTDTLFRKQLLSFFYVPWNLLLFTYLR